MLLIDNNGGRMFDGEPTNSGGIFDGIIADGRKITEQNQYYV